MNDGLKKLMIVVVFLGICVMFILGLVVVSLTYNNNKLGGEFGFCQENGFDSATGITYSGMFCMDNNADGTVSLVEYVFNGTERVFVSGGVESC